MIFVKRHSNLKLASTGTDNLLLTTSNRQIVQLHTSDAEPINDAIDVRRLVVIVDLHKNDALAGNQMIMQPPG